MTPVPTGRYGIKPDNSPTFQRNPRTLRFVYDLSDIYRIIIALVVLAALLLPSLSPLSLSTFTPSIRDEEARGTEEEEDRSCVATE